MLYAVGDVQRGSLRWQWQRHIHSGAFVTVRIFLTEKIQKLISRTYIYELLRKLDIFK